MIRDSRSAIRVSALKVDVKLRDTIVYVTLASLLLRLPPSLTNAGLTDSFLFFFFFFLFVTSDNYRKIFLSTFTDNRYADKGHQKTDPLFVCYARLSLSGESG